MRIIIARRKLLVASAMAFSLAATMMNATSVAVAQAPPPAAAAKAVKGPSAVLALEAIQAAIAACKASGYNEVAASVIDSSGELKAMLAADGTPPGHAVPHSALKAVTALTYKTPSAAVQTRTNADKAFAAEVEANPKLLARAGGELLMSKGEVIGAIGVSGAPGGDKDDACALAGVARIKDRL